MKLSNKILLGILIFVVLMQFGMTLKARSIIKKAMYQTSDINQTIWNDLINSDVQEKQFDVKDFDEVCLKMQGEAVIKQGDTYSISVKGPIDFMNSEYFTVDNNSNTLHIEYPRLRSHYDDLQVVITMPKLKKLKVEDDVTLKVEGFKENYIKIQLTGENSFFGLNNEFTNLKMDSFGETNFSMENSIVEDANMRCLGETDIALETTNLKIDAVGETDVDVKMNDGYIKGNIIGEGKLRYTGEIYKNGLNFLGPGKLIRK